MGLVCALAACLPLSGQAQPYFANKQGDQIWDKGTGLVWQRCSAGQTWDGTTCSGTPQEFNFDQAQNQGGDGWRVPTIRELASLVYCSSGKKEGERDLKDGGPVIAKACAGVHSRPPINTVAFPATVARFFWSSSSSVSSDTLAWYVEFSSGYVGDSNRNNGKLVRLVRTSQLSGSEAALAFPVSLAAKSRQVQAQEHARAVSEEAQRQQQKSAEVRKRQQQEAAEAREQEARRAYENSPAGRAEAERQQQARQMCEAQKQTCFASCPPYRSVHHSENSLIVNAGHFDCKRRCESISCY